ncbi:hypothetical protein CEUSTIGMA_g11088.t1 [Chlamydomonas eustigma]|uniref:RING-type domain-containing protein n=1 Tax=Chlamydomonas eustigma TaxID=1157962 RepID=A0A250XKW0_9CHLO|nr:hypothetical protein CEUSTIGMA_g11088.t1 [Chlamydomonas eustigma]|eukprot:GAX83663.1 hypothetical protein CEUSTIGMA_g11088.t1 [Chlamydomonas eustigma]
MLAPSTLTTDDSLDNPDDLTCAICLCQPDPVDIAIIKGCEHSYCEESVCLLKRATWFTQHIHTLDKGALLGASSFDQEHAYDEDDYEYDDEVEDEEESYYFSSASGRARVVLGNRRFGENGFVRGGRLMARPVQSPGPSYSAASSSSSSASSKQVGAQGSIKKTGGSSSSKAAGPAHAHNKYGSTGIGKPGNSVCVKNQSSNPTSCAGGGPSNHKQVTNSTLQVASMADAPPCAPDEVGLLAKGTGSSSVITTSGASGIYGSSSSSSLPTPSSVAVPKQGNGYIAPSTWEDKVAAGSNPLTPMCAVVAVERTQSVQNQQMSSFSSCSREAVTELCNQVSEAISTFLPSGTSLGLIDTLCDHEPDHLLSIGGSSDPLNENTVLKAPACTSELLTAQAEANTSTPQPTKQKNKKAAQQAGNKKKGSNYKKQHPHPCPDGQYSDHNFGVSVASGEAIPSMSSSVTLAKGTRTTVPSSVSHVSSCDNEALIHNSSAASAHNSRNNGGITRSGRRVSTRRAKDIARTFEEDYLVR